MTKGKVEIINVDLNLNLEEEIKKQTAVEASAKSRIDSIIERAKLRQDKSGPTKQQKEAEELETQFKPLFEAMLATKEITQEETSKILNVPVLQLGAALGKFKKYLRVAKNNEFVLFIGKNAAKQKVYYLKRISDPL